MATFQVFKSNLNNQFFYHLRATGNSEIILRGEGYKSKEGCLAGIASVKVNAPYDVRYDRLYSINRQYYFNLKGANGEIIGTSETYTSPSARDRGIEIVKVQAPTATVQDKTV